MSEILVNTIKKADGTGSITVPADTGTVLTTATAASSIPGYGNLTMVDQWRLNASVTSNGVNLETLLTANLEQNDDASFSTFGSSMTESSGVFTFPETGLYMVLYTLGMQLDGNARYFYTYTYHSSNSGSSFDIVSATLNTLVKTIGISFASTTTHSIMNVTDASTHRCRFGFASDSASIATSAETAQNQTHMTFIRLGDAQ